MREIKLPPINKELEMRRPYAAKYAQLHGMQRLISEVWPEVDYHKEGYKSTEEVYKECLDEGMTWEELLDFDPDQLKGMTL